jgi:CheY-like chemotaxis protein
MKVLVVDDDRVSRAVYKKVLGNAGYEVLEASDGFEALHRIHHDDIDLVTLDIDMPDMDGYQVCTWLRSEQFTNRLKDKGEDPAKSLLPVIFLTSDDSLETRLKGFRAGATDFVVKGSRPDTLINIVDRILKPKNQLQDMHALVVDDSRVVRDMVTKMLVENGVIVQQANDGSEAYKLIEAAPEAFDLILLDLEMPIMRGDELCVKIRKELGLKDLPIIFLTAVPDRGALIHLFEVGANDYLVKPFVKEELIARIKVNLKTSQHITKEATERRQIEKDLAKTKRMVASSRKAAERADLASTVLHNVGNVMNSISASCAHLEHMLEESRLPQVLMSFQMVDKHKDDLHTFLTDDPRGKNLTTYFSAVGPELERHHRQIVEEVTELSKKINLIKEIIQIQHQRTKLGHERGEVVFSSLVKEALTVIAPLFERYEVEINEDLDPKLKAKVSSVQMVHVLVNILKNAVEAMRSTDDRKLWLSQSVDDTNTMSFSVHDSGEGIDPDHLKRIFESGFTTKQDGHGLGLPYCRKEVEENGGQLTVSSDGLGKGATFTITIPLSRD